ncbi:Transcriptional repressor IclR [Mycolicibacterium vanbaalenii]|uniref:Transcriptional repressor IclR n=1 Tax=Mycolicibacterium vanbaalenii TaxID=110539 RepID=A0A5S9PMI8_MYCVN|nr:IclR family transcriptional regulator C-terminal domain-containing protein [Mycolicibacterium vanbaalenii]CAA0105337.1 Transcriptional repressor IclR [Mycolicibacterium vanbaalenii]
MHTESVASPTLIQSLQRGMRLVEAVTRWGPLTARELSNRTGIVLPTTYHLVRTLVHEGYLRRLADGRYSLGYQMASVNQLEFRARSLRLIREGIAALAAEARVTVSIGELCDGDIVVTQFVTHASTPRFECWRGMTIPGHATAVGKDILRRMSTPQRAAYVAKHPFEARTTHTVTTAARLEHEMADNEVARSDQEFAYGISCVAVSLIGGERLMALGAAFPSSRTPRVREQTEATVSQTAARISDAIGIASASAADTGSRK